MTSVRDAQQRANAETFLAWLLGPDQFGVTYGNAMRLGVMYIGWNDRIWRGYDIKRGWTELKGCFATPSAGSDTTCHRNHIHISLTWDGASGRTSFWDGTPIDGPYCAPERSGGHDPGGGRAADVVPVEPVHVLGTRKATGVAVRCRLQQDRWSGDSHRIYAKVTGQGGVADDRGRRCCGPGHGHGIQRDSNVRIWSPGQSQEPGRRQGPHEHGRDGHGDRACRVRRDHRPGHVGGSHGPLGRRHRLLPAGDTPNDTVATPGASRPMGDEPAPVPLRSPRPRPRRQPCRPTPMTSAGRVHLDRLGGRLRVGGTGPPPAGRGAGRRPGRRARRGDVGPRPRHDPGGHQARQPAHRHAGKNSAPRRSPSRRRAFGPRSWWCRSPARR